MRRALVLGLVCCQLLVLAYMAGSRETIRRYGQQIYLRTAPVDPRDPFRGEFVRLNYPMSTIHERDLRGEVSRHRDEKGYPVYALLKAGDQGLYQLDYVTDHKPQQGLFLKGRISPDWRSRGGASVAVKYGIEQYFVEQGQGQLIERRRGARDDLQVPMEVEIVVAADGTAVVRDFRWSALGIKLELLRFSRRGADGQPVDPDQPLSPRVRVTLENVSTQPLQLVDPGNHCGFTLETISWSGQDYPLAADCTRASIGTGDLQRLLPGQQYSVEIELSDPRWRVLNQGQAVEIGALPAAEMFRLVYRSPPSAELAGLTNGEEIWQGELPGRAFNAFGRLD